MLLVWPNTTRTWAACGKWKSACDTRAHCNGRTDAVDGEGWREGAREDPIAGGGVKGKRVFRGLIRPMRHHTE